MPVTKKFARAGFIWLVLIVIYIEYAQAEWKQVAQFGGYGLSGREVISKTNVTIESSPSEKTTHAIYFDGQGKKVFTVYVARLDDNAQLEYEQDYYMSIVGGGVYGARFVTLQWEIKPNPTEEPLNFEVQLIAYSL